MQEGRGGYGAHTVKNWWAKEDLWTTQERKKCESFQRKKRRRRPKKKGGRNVCEKKVKNFLTHTLARIDRPAEPRRL